MSNIKTASLLTKEGEAVLLEGISINGDVRGPIFDAIVTQHYKNNSKSAVEIIYNFPLPFAAVLLGVEVTLGEVCLKGKVVEKSKAADGYEDLISNGDTAILIERTNDHNHCMNLGNLGAGDSCTIKLRYGQVLKYEQGKLRLQIPTVLAPRYGDAISDGGFDPHQEYSNDLMASYAFDLSLRLHGQLSQGRMSSPSHAISIYHHSQSEETSNAPYTDIGLGRSYTLDRDFVLSIDDIKQESLTVQSPDFADDRGHVVLVGFCPEMEQDDQKSLLQPLALKILVDCSGSMAGDSIESVKSALRFITREIKPNDRFMLSKFGNQIKHRSRGLWRVSAPSIHATKQWIDNLQADMGGTELRSALESTIQKANSVKSDVLLITDGEVHAIDSIIETAKNSGQRINVVGIGSSPVESHLRRLANATGGACEFIAPGEDVKPSVIKMFNRIRHQAYGNIRVVWPENIEIKYQTSINAAVCKGDAVNVFAWIGAPVEGDVTLVGTIEGANEEQVLAKAHIEKIIDSDVISRIGASERVCTEESDGLDLSVAYQLIGDKTSMLLEHIRSDEQKQNDMPTMYKIAQMVPAGWGGTGGVRDVVRYMRMPRAQEIQFSKKAPEASGTLTKKDIDDLVKQITQDSEIRKQERQRYRESVNSKADALKSFLESYKPDQINAQKETHKPKRKIKMTDRNNPLLWSGANDSNALTPMGMVEWLRVNEGLYHIDNFELLDLIGVPAEMIDWLDLQFVKDEASQLAQELSVKMFVHVMRNFKTMEYIKGLIDYGCWEQEIVAATFENKCMATDEKVAIVMKITSQLKGMRATNWSQNISTEFDN